MIEIMIAVNLYGNLKSLKAEGHSISAAKGSNIICAAVSAQLRSVVRVISSCNGCKSQVTADHDGFLELSVDTGDGENRWLTGVTDVLLAGLMEVERDNPRECKITLIKLS